MNAAVFLRRTREAEHLTQRALAAQAHTTQACISRYETGSVDPTVNALANLVQAMGLELVLEARRV